MGISFYRQIGAEPRQRVPCWSHRSLRHLQPLWIAPWGIEIVKPVQNAKLGLLHKTKVCFTLSFAMAAFAEALVLLAADSAETVVVVVGSVADAAGFAGWKSLGSGHQWNPGSSASRWSPVADSEQVLEDWKSLQMIILNSAWKMKNSEPIWFLIV